MSTPPPDVFVHVEEPSMKVAMDVLCSRMMGALAGRVTVIDHASKRQLLAKLPNRLLGYRHLGQAVRVMVLVDRDDDDCRTLKAGLETISSQAGHRTKSAPGPDGRFSVVNRIVIEELEAWFFGDVEALRIEYPRLPQHLADQSPFRDADAIKGGTWEALHRVLRKAGYYVDAPLPKIEVARRVAPHMDASRNRSRSFQVFAEGLRALCHV